MGPAALTLPAQGLAMVGLACALAACAPAERAPTTAFRGPTGMALAGRAFDKVYVANTGTDTLQVVQLTQDMRRIDLAPAPARYFPLNIPGGPNPQEVAASADGRFVFVLDKITSTLRLIDADALVLAKGADGQPLSLPLGPSDVGASALLGSPWTCAPSEQNPQSICLGRSFVGLRRLNAVAAVDVRQSIADNRLFLQVDSTMALGAAPVRMAAHPAAAVLFITDAQAPEVLRVTLSAQGSLAQGFISRTALGVPGGALAVAGDGTVLAVARPAFRDVMLLASDAHNVAEGTLVPLDANPVRTPLPQCISPCNQPALGACEDAHVADSALCSEPVGYGNGPHPYTALYLGSVPTALLALDSTAMGMPLTERCTAQSPEGVTPFAQGFAVASMDGTIEYIGLSQGTNGTILARMLDKASCDAPKVRTSGQSLALVEDVLAPCAPLPQGRARMACLMEEDGDGIGRVGLMRGHGESRPLGLAWEGILPGGDRSGGGGAIGADGTLYDGGSTSSQDLGQLPIRVREQDSLGQTIFAGDVVQVLTQQIDSEACGHQGTSASTLCELERRVVGLQSIDGRTHLVLDRPLDSACFNAGVQLAYRVRAGDAFLVGPLDERASFASPPVRLGPGQTYGEGLQGGATGPLFFTIDPKLDVGADLTSCARYLDDNAAAGAPPWRSRKSMTTFSVSDPYAPVRSGQQVDPLRNQLVNSGQMPYAMVMTRGPVGAGAAAVSPPVLLVSFAGSDGVLIASPLEPPIAAGSEPKERLLQ